MKKETKCILFGLCALAALLEELYMIFAHSQEALLVTVGVGVFLFFSYLFFCNLLAMKREQQEEQLQQQLEQQELIKKVLKQLKASNSYDSSDDSTKQAISDLQHTQKAIYVSIQKQTKCIQSLLQQLSQNISVNFSDLSEQIKEELEQNTKISVKHGRENTKNLMVFQEKAFDNVTLGMEETVRQYVACTDKTLAALNALSIQPVSAPVTTSTSQPEEAVLEEVITPVAEEPAIEEMVAPTAEEPAIEEMVAPIVEEPAPEPEPVNDDPNHMMTPEEIAALVSGNSSPEPTPEPEPVNDDSNRMMTPEEIAALVAGNSSPAPEPTPEPEPVNSDPNHMMTPEEIAALIANNN